MPAIGVVIGWLIGAIGLALTNWAGRVLVSLGIAYVTYSGIDVLMTSIKSDIFSLLNTGSVIPGIIGLSRLGESVNVIFSAIAAKYALAGLSNGSITKARIK